MFEERTDEHTVFATRDFDEDDDQGNDQNKNKDFAAGGHPIITSQTNARIEQ